MLTSTLRITYTYTYDSLQHPHAVTALSGGETYEYYAWGGMTTANLGGSSYTYRYTSQGRLERVDKDNVLQLRLYYDADDRVVRKTGEGGEVVYAGAWEKNYTLDTATSYYYAGSLRIAERRGGTLYYVHSDHLGSASLATDAGGAVVAGSDTRYSPEGGIRQGGTGLPTDRRFTGQRQEAELGVAGYGLYDYAARWPDPYLYRWIQPDTIVRATRSRWLEYWPAWLVMPDQAPR